MQSLNDNWALNELAAAESQVSEINARLNRQHQLVEQLAAQAAEDRHRLRTMNFR
jgi:hypothetical protein